ncbi:MAG: UDP-3-O-[3-hydroxymyristoyl] N-acetylglucosamine deacetylase [Planctomycetes bacterium]|nr:UDP-3-O-[3-hydroxymyristoyl] N-acetylglucosamine deacetylase [Planctomycetota bacterium]
MPFRSQQTIRRAVAVAGRGYWSGQPCRVEFLPAPANTGITFLRTVRGVPVRIPVSAESRVESRARTNLAVAGVTVQMVEHAVSALVGLRIDCCLVRVSAEELPGLDGSSRAFVAALDEAGIERLGSPIKPLVVREPCRVTDGEAWIEALPPQHAGLSIDYEIDYGPGPIGRQTLSFRLSPDGYRADVASARTFITRSEAERLRAAGLAADVSTSDLVVFGDDGPIDNPLRWPDECVRHKVLDLVGDLALAGRPIHAHVRASRSGHRLNALLAARLRSLSWRRASA